MSGQATERRVTLYCMIRKRTGIREYLTRDLELSQASNLEREKERERKREKEKEREEKNKKQEVD